MQYVSQGDQHILVLADAEYRMLRRMIAIGRGFSPYDLGLTKPDQQAVWQTLAEWAHNGGVKP